MENDGDEIDVEAWQHAWINEGLRVVEKVESIAYELQNFKVSDLVDENVNGKDKLVIKMRWSGHGKRFGLYMWQRGTNSSYG
ncbi:hypothetical protein TSUD_220900 [Trifolium subterraneum]|uniref:Uncharacterized protein n=1 Tax=Trifolium subterraneum TaxID=3900 RepID=A0A2Z6NP37_TRISU|nr:hypothetical protein TSUD_220900 [Trifolium subterraneum]